MSTLEKKKLKYEQERYILDKAAAVLLNPVPLLLGGFVLSNYLQHKEMMIAEKTTAGHYDYVEGPSPGSFFGVPAPGTLTKVWTPDSVEYYPMTWLTDDQANGLRAGMIGAVAMSAASSSGIWDTIKGLFVK